MRKIMKKKKNTPIQKKFPQKGDKKNKAKINEQKCSSRDGTIRWNRKECL
jgi:hypothetical protein